MLRQNSWYGYWKKKEINHVYNYKKDIDRQIEIVRFVQEINEKAGNKRFLTDDRQSETT